MGSDYDYINEHMGGFDEDGLPNFMSEPGFADDDYQTNLVEKDDDVLVKYMMLNHNWSYVIRGIHDAYESRGYLLTKEENALKTMMNRGLGQKPDD